METITEWFIAGIPGAQPLGSSTTETDWKAMGQCIEIDDADQEWTASDADQEWTASNAEELEKYSIYRYHFDRSLDNFANQKEVTTTKLAFHDSILHDAHVYILVVVDLILLYVNHTSLYRVLLISTLANNYVLIWVPLCASLITLLFLYLYINHFPFLFLEEDIKWIRKESRLLSATSEDAEEVKRLCFKIDARAHQIWDSIFPSKGTVPGPEETEVQLVDKTVTVAGLDEIEAKWVDKIASIVKKAQGLVKTFEEKRRDSHRLGIFFGMTTKNFEQTDKLFSITKQVKEEIKSSIVMKKESGINICESLDRLKSNARRLLERPFDEHEKRWVNSGERVESAAALAFSTVEKINTLLIQNPDLMPDRSRTGEQLQSTNLQLQLLHPFLKDIQGINEFESAIEKAWVEEVEEIIDEAHPAIENFLQTPSNRFRWLSYISSWRARRKLEGDLRCINVGFTQALERKDRYGFKFIRRISNSSKIVYQSPDQTADENSVSSVIDRMRNYLKEKPNVFREVFFDVKLLCNELEIMHKLVGGAGMIGRRYNSRVAWLEQVRKIVQSADESVVTFMKMNSGLEEDRDEKKLKNSGRKLSLEINQINQTINLFLRCIKAFSIESREDLSSVVGLEEDIDAVVSRLRTNNEHCSFVSIVGIEGIGKTTLAKKIYNHGVIVDHFPCRAWVSLPHDYSYNNKLPLLKYVAKQVLSSVKSEGHQEINSDASNRIEEAHAILKKNRYLLVLDNISTMYEWSTLKAAFPLSTSSGSRILLTTRNPEVASQVDSDSTPHQLPRLTKEESWQLFSQVVHIPPKGKMLAKEILSKCEGLPLAMVRLMSGKDETTAQELKKVIQYIKQDDDTSSFCTYTKECINKFPVHLTDCLSCFKLFPKDYKIPVRRLFALWIAEELVEVSEHKTDNHESDPKKKAETYEEAADEHLSELIDRDIVHVVERKLNGKVKTCCLNKDLQEVIRSQAMRLDYRRLADHVNCKDPSFDLIHGECSNFSRSYKDIISILSFDSQEGYKPGEDIGNFLRRGIAGGYFLQLKFLDLERVFRPELPNTIVKLSNLRYLGLRWTSLESIPDSIGELVNLQTLDVKHTYVRTLPRSIWKLLKLRHLYLSQRYRSKFMRHQGLNSLKNLQTLWGVFVDKHSPLKDGLDKFINLRKLGLAFQLEKEEQKVLAERIVKLSYLKSLRMRSIDEMGEPCPLVLESLSGLENLSSLNLFGMLENPSIIAGFPKNLIDLTLSASSFSEDPMPKLEKLSNLQSLCFYSNSYTGTKMVCSTWGFQKLVVLKLWKLERLEDWDVEENAMQNIRELEIRSCNKLKVPTGLRHLKTLIELKLINMPEEFSATIEKTNVDIWGDIAHSPTIITNSW
ncbi:PREDICTED: probable disease resistance RPP8-like protein 2 [Prunus mume]|uniref:Probable disease resistance RPP8-like protein 2 n=1 Tax=Prunus mume TaxID=102107 RepID=A0ABM0NQN1_PRUMU|nr:PREDICTED: probable disease resistance RPP8-like protein 2 [Prunus mume]